MSSSTRPRASSQARGSSPPPDATCTRLDSQLQAFGSQRDALTAQMSKLLEGAKVLPLILRGRLLLAQVDAAAR